MHAVSGTPKRGERAIDTPCGRWVRLGQRANVQAVESDFAVCIVRLQHDCASLCSEPFPRIVAWYACVLPVNYLHAVHPSAHPRPISDDSQKGLICCIRKNCFGVLTSENGSHSRIDRTTPIFLEAMMDLAFVPVHVFARYATKEQSGIDIVRKGLDGNLEAAIRVRLKQFDVPFSASHGQ